MKSFPNKKNQSHKHAKNLITVAAQQEQQQEQQAIERVRVSIPNAHVFKLPPRASASGWRGADWRDKLWQGTLKVIDRSVYSDEDGDGDGNSKKEETAILLLDSKNGSVFAVCPVTNREGAVDRCIDSSRYFILRIENAKQQHMFIGLAFNERNDAFDFNTALQDAKREQETMQRMLIGQELAVAGPMKDYSLKEGQKIRVNLKPKILKSMDATLPGDGVSSSWDSSKSGDSCSGSSSGAFQHQNSIKPKTPAKKGGLLAPSSKDTPSRRREM